MPTPTTGNSSETDNDLTSKPNQQAASSNGAVDSLSLIDRVLIQHLPERFKVRKTLGKGTYGIVYLARDERHKRDVAIKILRPEWMAVPNTKNRFLRESQAAARLNHSAIVRVLESDENAKIAWQVCDAINGDSLAAHLCCGPMDPKVAAQLIAKLADAVHCAHLNGVVHRDIKPENILIQMSATGLLADAQIYLTDFGLAKIRDDDLDQSRSGTLVGTPRYMAPEMFDALDHRALPSADVYALGAILFECLAGQNPFGESSSIVQRIKQGLTLHPSPRQFVPGLSKDIETICLKSMAPDPSKRYPTANDLAEDLNSYFRNLPIKARSLTTSEKIVRFVREHQGLVMTTSAIIICLAIVAAISLQSRNTIRKKNIALESFNEEIESARKKAEIEQQKFATLAWSAGVREAFRYWEDSQLCEAKQALVKLSQSYSDANKRLDWQLLASELNGQFQELQRIDSSIEEIRTIPNTTKVAAVSSNGHLYVIDASTGEVLKDIESELPSLNALAVHPTEPYLLFGGVTFPNRHIASIYKFNLQTDELSKIADGFETTLESLEISQDGTSVLAASRYRNVKLLDLNTFTSQESPADRRNTWIARVAGTKKFAYQKSDTLVGFVDGSESKEGALPSTMKTVGIIQCGVGIPGTSLVAISEDGLQGISVIDVASRSIVARLTHHGISKVRCMSCSEDGSLLCVGSESGDVVTWKLDDQRWWRLHRTDSNLIDIDTEGDAPSSLSATGRWHVANSPIMSISVSGDKLVCGSQSGDFLSLSLARWLASDENEKYQIHTKAARNFDVAFGRDLSTIALRLTDGSTYLSHLSDDHWRPTPEQDHENSTASSSRPRLSGLIASQLPLHAVLDDTMKVQKDFSSSHRARNVAAGRNSTFAWLKSLSTLEVSSESISKQIDLEFVPDKGEELKVVGLSQDGSRIAICGSRRVFVISTVNQGSLEREIGKLEGSPWTVDWHPTENRILIGGEFNGIYEYNLDTGELSLPFALPSPAIHVLYAVQGTTVVSAHADGTIRVSNLKTGEQQSQSAHKCPVLCMTLCNSSSIGLSVDEENNVALWRFPKLEKIGRLISGQSHMHHDIHVRPKIGLSADSSRLLLIRNNDRQPELRLWTLKN